MGKKSKATMYNGFLLIDKSAGMTSHDVVHKVRGILGQRQVGHAGTLDPLATGLLVILLGNATKLSQYILEGDKRYRVKIEVGVDSPTLDIDSDELVRVDHCVDSKEIQEQLADLEGRFCWPVPKYSAIKINGKKLYEYARENIPVDLPEKDMNFFDLDIGVASGRYVEFEVSCSKGSFIRSMAEQLGHRLGIPSAVCELRRIASTPYGVERSISLEQLKSEFSNSDERIAEVSAFVSMAETLEHWPCHEVSGRDFKLLQNGQISRDLSQILVTNYALKNLKQVKLLTNQGQDLVALAEFNGPKGFCLRRVFQA